MPEVMGFRIASWDTPLRANPNRSAGRWNRAGAPATQYISLHPWGAWAEYLRWHGISSASRARDLRQAIWAIRVIVDEIRVVRFDNAAESGIAPESLVHDDWTACQEVAENIRQDSKSSNVIQVPNAGLPGTQNIVILEERVAMAFTGEPVDDLDLPVALIATHARPPEALLEMVRHRGEPHAEYESWIAGAKYTFEEPPAAELVRGLTLN